MGNDYELAIKAAEEILLAEGFKPSASGNWVGQFLIAGNRIGSEIKFPQQFPQKVPDVWVDWKTLPKRIPHVENDGKVCLVPSSGVLVDAARPASIVKDILARAHSVLEDGISGANAPDFIEEFLGYWNPARKEIVESICTPTGPSREICLLKYRLPSAPEKVSILLADDLATGQAWLSRAAWQFVDSERAWFHSVTTAVMPPDFRAKILVRDFVKLVRSNSSEADCEALKEWLSKVGLPRTIICSMPAQKNTGAVLYGVKFSKPTGGAVGEAKNGFRDHKVPALREFCFTLHLPLHPIQVERLDTEYLLPRGGNTKGLRDKTAVVVGCGAVGSLLTEKLACLGVGTLRLIDPEPLQPENLYRHVLGVEFLFQNKAKAMQVALGKRFPSLNVEADDRPVEEVIKDKREFLLSANLICVALGDGTTELWLNDLLEDHIPRIHAWVEPLGIGGHVFATGTVNGAGCYRCLFKDNPESGLSNASAFAEPGQNFGRSLAGCSGTFTPFAFWDADRTASEAAKLATRILSGLEQRSALVSWYGDPQEFLKHFKLSRRARMFEPGQTKTEYDFQDQNCACQQWGAKK